MVLTALGCALGILFAFMVLDGTMASTTGADQMQVGFQLRLSPLLIAQAVILALAIGTIGGGLSALHATRIPLQAALLGRD